jgi:putative transposase
VLQDEIARRLYQLIPDIVNKLKGRVLNLTIRPDHVHLFVEVPPTLAPRQIMHRIKGFTSHELREEFPTLKSRLPSLWTRTYYVGTAGRVSESTIQRYIDQQKGA